MINDKNKSKMVCLDCEVYPNFFLVAFKSAGGTLKNFSIFGEGERFSFDDRSAIAKILHRFPTLGFNSINFDLPLIYHALQGATTAQLFKVCEYIIGGGKPYFMTMQDFRIEPPPGLRLNHYDLIGVAPGAASLKLYGARLHCVRLQDLPIAPGTVLSEEQRDGITRYCENDLDVTLLLYRELKPQIYLREKLGEKYRLVSLVSAGDAKIAEVYFKSHYPDHKRRIASGVASEYRYVAPPYLECKSLPITRGVREFLEGEVFKLSDKGRVLLPDGLEKVRVGDTVYKIGLGGLHSQEKKVTYRAGGEGGEGGESGSLIVDRDVTSYYPQLILNLGGYPAKLDGRFITLYQRLVSDRVEAKRVGDTVTADGNKITINSVFGKTSNKYSLLYDPGFTIAVTITGQLTLLMLIERLESLGVRVVSANTDGFVSLIDDARQYALYCRTCDAWCKWVGLRLEETRYQALHIRDVNNYLGVVAVESSDLKKKGVFVYDSITKNPHANICIKAAIAHLVDGVPLDTTVNAYDNLHDYLIVRTVRGGAIWRGVVLGKVARWVYVVGSAGDVITYKSNGNKVPKSDGSYPVMDLDEGLGDGVVLDYDRYVLEALRLVGDVGL